MIGDGLAAFGSVYEERRKERQRQSVVVPPEVAAARGLGLDGPLTLERLVTDPELGALPATPAQVALLRALDGTPIGDVLTRRQMLFHFDAEAIPEARPSIVYLRTGVRAGKTLISVLDVLHSVLTCQFRRPPDLEKGERPGPDGMVGVRPGELVRAVVVAPKLKLARSPLAHLVGTMEAAPRLRKLFAEKPNKESCKIRRHDGREVVIELVAADVGGAGLRSTWLAGAMLDEADFHDDEGAAVNLDDNLDACRSRMLSGARIMVPSSPWAEGSQFDKSFTAARKAPLHLGELGFHSDTVSMNPTVDRNAIERLRQRDPDVAAREYDAIPYGAGAEAFYPEDAIRMTFTRTEMHVESGDGARVEVLPPEPRHAHTAGTDLGFRKNSSALAISRSEGGRVRLAFRLELRPPRGASLKPSEVVREFAFWCMRYGAPAMVGDLHYADTAHEELGKLRRALEKPGDADAEQRAWVERVRADPYARTAKVPVYLEWDTSQAHTADVHTEMRRRMQEGLVELPADDRMREQARETKRKAAPGGHVQILLPKRGQAHGDLWGATVIACTEASLATVAPPKRRLNAGHSGFGEIDGGGRGFGE